jgi:hypothetical protein
MSTIYSLPVLHHHTLEVSMSYPIHPYIMEAIAAQRQAELASAAEEHRRVARVTEPARRRSVGPAASKIRETPALTGA